MSIRKGVGRYLAMILSDTIIAIRIAKNRRGTNTEQTVAKYHQ